MSAPDTNVKKQEKQHKPALLGIKGAMVFGALMLIVVIFYATFNAGTATDEMIINPDPTSEIGADTSTTTPAAEPAAPDATATD